MKPIKREIEFLGIEFYYYTAESASPGCPSYPDNMK
jgi:hypothetical protein